MAMHGYTVQDPHRAIAMAWLQNHPTQQARIEAGAPQLRSEDFGVRSMLFIPGGLRGGSPTEAKLRRLARLAVELNRFFFRNDESIIEPHRGDEATIEANMRRLLWEAEVLRSEAPHLAYSFYNMPSTNGSFDAGNQPDRLRRLRENFARASWYRLEDGTRSRRGLIASQPYLTPSLYQPAQADKPLFFRRWEDWARIVVDLCHEYQKLAIPVISMNYQGHPNMDVLPPEEFASQTDWCIRNAAGVIWWSAARRGQSNWDQRHEACYASGMEVLRGYGLDVPITVAL